MDDKLSEIMLNQETWKIKVNAADKDQEELVKIVKYKEEEETNFYGNTLFLVCESLFLFMFLV